MADGVTRPFASRSGRRHPGRAIALAMAGLAVGAVATPDAPQASGWPFEGASVETLLRLFADKQHVEGVVDRHAQTANFRVQANGGLTRGDVAVGLDAGLYAGADLFSSRNAGNMAHQEPDGTPGSPVWAYVGEYGIRLQHGDSALHVGQQRFSNPFLESHDNRGLPPTFRGWSASALPTEGLHVAAGSVNAVIPRGMASCHPLTTNYAGIPVQRFDFGGVDYDIGHGTNLSAYLGRAQDVWSQAFVSAGTMVGDPEGVHLAGVLAGYRTRDSGSARQGRIDTDAYSVALSPGWHATTLTVAYQRIAGDQFFDYLGETSGMSLSNAYAVDYNAPHERSLLLALSTDLGPLGWPAFKAMAWRIQGRGADGTVSAGLHADPGDPLHALYWKSGEPVSGAHREVGLLLSHEGQHKGAAEKLILMRHWGGPFYPDPPFYEAKFLVERVF